MQQRAFRRVEFPRSRLATFDIGVIGKEKHYVTAMLELNVGAARKKIRGEQKRSGQRISFTGWLLRTIAETVSQHKEVAAFRHGRRGLVIFDDVDISVLVEKEVDGYRVPLPLLIRKANQKTAAEITAEIEEAKTSRPSEQQMVVGKRTSLGERLYYFLPGFVRRMAWRVMMKHPRFVFDKMGCIVVTSVGMMGRVNGWFIQTSIHPLSFGVGSVLKKPVVVGNEVVIGEVLNMTVLIDHNTVDGAPMARFVSALSKAVETASVV